MLKILGVLTLCMAACSTAPKSEGERHDLATEAQTTLHSMMARDPSLSDMIHRSYAYAVFPKIGKGGFIIGAAYGKGLLYENGMPTGYVELNQGSFGAQLGAQTFSELIVFQSREAVTKVKSGTFGLGADATAVALTAGAGSTAIFKGGVAVFVDVHGGAMVGITLNGQQINYKSGKG